MSPLFTLATGRRPRLSLHRGWALVLLREVEVALRGGVYHGVLVNQAALLWADNIERGPQALN
jgi:hypothetical protein